MLVAPAPLLLRLSNNACTRNAARRAGATKELKMRRSILYATTKYYKRVEQVYASIRWAYHDTSVRVGEFFFYSCIM